MMVYWNSAAGIIYRLFIEDARPNEREIEMLPSELREHHHIFAKGVYEEQLRLTGNPWYPLIDGSWSCNINDPRNLIWLHKFDLNNGHPMAQHYCAILWGGTQWYAAEAMQKRAMKNWPVTPEVIARIEVARIEKFKLHPFSGTKFWISDKFRPRRKGTSGACVQDIVRASPGIEWDDIRKKYHRLFATQILERGGFEKQGHKWQNDLYYDIYFGWMRFEQFSEDLFQYAKDRITNNLGFDPLDPVTGKRRSVAGWDLNTYRLERIKLRQQT